MCVKGGYHLHVNEDERVMEAEAVRSSSSRGYSVEMVHTVITQDKHHIEPQAS